MADCTLSLYSYLDIQGANILSSSCNDEMMLLHYRTEQIQVLPMLQLTVRTMQHPWCCTDANYEVPAGAFMTSELPTVDLGEEISDSHP